MKSERSAALVLMAAAIAGLVLANSPLGEQLLNFKNLDLGILISRPKPKHRTLG